MRHKVSDINELFKSHNYDVDSIIPKMFRKFKLKFAIHKSNGFEIMEIVITLLYLPLLGIRSVHKIYESYYSNIAAMKKDTIYRFNNSTKTDWRRVLLHTAKTFDTLTGTKKEDVDSKTCLILDDTTLEKSGIHTEKVSYVFDHVTRTYMLGYKNLTCAHFDGMSYKVVDFSLHREGVKNENKRTKKMLKEQYKTIVDKKDPITKRLKECDNNKMEISL